MRRRLIIDGNAVYEIDEDCMLHKSGDQEKVQKDRYRRYDEKTNREEQKK